MYQFLKITFRLFLSLFHKFRDFRISITVIYKISFDCPLVQKYLIPLTLTQAKQKDLLTYVPRLVPADIFNFYWRPILNAVPSTDSDVDDDENV